MQFFIAMTPPTSTAQMKSMTPPVTVEAMAGYLGKSTRCIRDWLKEMDDVFWYKGGIIGRIEELP